MLAILFSVLAGFCFAASSVFSQKGLSLLATPWAVLITLISNCLLLWLIYFLSHPALPTFTSAHFPFVLIGIFVPGVTRLLVFRGLKELGSSITSTVVNSTPMFSATLAIIFLQERPGPLVLSGIGLIVGGLATLSWGGEKRSWSRVELLYPILAALLFGAKDIVARWGLGAVGDPVSAAAITVTSATVAIYVMFRYFQGNRFSMPPLRVSFWFVASGLFSGGSFLFQYQALYIERVSIVSPIVNSYSVFVLFLAPLIVGKIERITPRKIVAALVIVAGVFLVTLGKD